ncbi:hypothetical protein EDD68_107101 [Melghiribacillus thermohalophilus]|uniref:Uncharacterized protein n=1 Tax=Melghiribacillus thermohalophilus TaxID=1324956 RepID=A0A4R3N4S1_9BACI|nr:hypothetical protein [Melghiribacillus thermohalophilus]TCT23387.1 hypothetical protein EDD68_107101 [Melghiribacillus thermohalophilus]
MPKVLKIFEDKHTKKVYIPGNEYHADPERLKELAEKGFIEYEAHNEDSNTEKDENQKENHEAPEQKAAEEETKQEEFPKHVGGGYFELSNGERVKGKEEALKAQSELE